MVQGETEKEAQDYFDEYVNQKGDWEAATNLVDTMIANAKTLPTEVLAEMKKHFIAGWGGYPIIGTPEQIVDGLEHHVEDRPRRHAAQLPALHRRHALVPEAGLSAGAAGGIAIGADGGANPAPWRRMPHCRDSCATPSKITRKAAHGHLRGTLQ